MAKTEINIPKILTKKLYITLTSKGYDIGKIGVWDCDVSTNSSGDYLLLHSEDVTIELPVTDEGEIRAKIITKLKERQDEIAAKAEMAHREVQGQIYDLLQIEYRVVEEGDGSSANDVPTAPEVEF